MEAAASTLLDIAQRTSEWPNTPLLKYTNLKKYKAIAKRELATLIEQAHC